MYASVYMKYMHIDELSPIHIYLSIYIYIYMLVEGTSRSNFLKAR